jgi:hypothetical protein
MSVTPWTPIFQGIDRAVGTNYPNASTPIPRLQSVNCVRVDLGHPDVKLFTTPPASNLVAESRETYSLSVSNFLKQYSLKVATDCNFYSASPGAGDPQSEGIQCNVYGLQICTGAVVSAATAALEQRFASLLFTTNKEPSFVWANAPPGTNTAGIYTAVTGYYPILTNGVNVWAQYYNDFAAAYPDPTVHSTQPRTTLGVSADQRYLFLMVIDGRQGGYSDGALDAETGLWMLQFGGWNAVSMDGGGSTCLYMADCFGNPVPLGHSSYIAGRNRERYIGSHFGVVSKELPGFISGVQVTPGNTTANIAWATAAPASSQVDYGLTSSLGSSSTLDPTLLTNHSVDLTGLTSGASYYYRIRSATPTQEYLLAGCAPFRTTNAYAVSAMAFDLTNVWAYSTTSMDATPEWTQPTYNDSTWPCGPGVLWADSRPNPPNPIPLKNTQMPVDPATTYAYVTYYLRTSFVFTNDPTGATLTFSNFIDDGAVFYLNGAEVQRAFMPASPTVINNATVSTGYPCASGDANCAYLFTLSGNQVASLVRGTNVVAVEVHNYRANSPDVTYGGALFYTVPPVVAQPPFITNLTAAPGESSATISWVTRSNSTTQVEYGLTTNLGTFTVLDPSLRINHSAALTGLGLKTNYYFRALSTAGTTTYSATGAFATIPLYQPLVQMTQPWRYWTGNLDGMAWQTAAFNDSAWPSGISLFWIDRDTYPNPNVQPKYTQLPGDPVIINDPFSAYYFRTAVVVTNKPAGLSLVFSSFVDDGAVFYLNGKEINRLRMLPQPAIITNGSFATGEPPTGDAVSADVFRLGGAALTNLVVGTNLLAVELHNASTFNLDATFGSTVGWVRAVASETALRLSYSGTNLCVSWDASYLTLQQSSDPAVPSSWVDVPGPVKTSPYCLTNLTGLRFFRLRN